MDLLFISPKASSNLIFLKLLCFLISLHTHQEESNLLPQKYVQNFPVSLSVTVMAFPCHSKCLFKQTLLTSWWVFCLYQSIHSLSFCSDRDENEIAEDLREYVNYFNTENWNFNKRILNCYCVSKTRHTI